MDPGSRTPPLYRWLDFASGALLMAMIVWAPWAFGSVPAWSCTALCGAGYLLGVLLLAKHLIRMRTGFLPPRWVEPSPSPAGRWAVRAMAVLTLVALEYLLVSWFNARSSIQIGHRGVDLLYHSRPSIPWLPTTYDSAATLQSLGLYGALACAFWSARDWLLGRSRSERHASDSTLFPPERLARLLWTLCISSTLLALVSMIQRMDGTDRLLWMLPTSIPGQVFPGYLNSSLHSWGPFAARSAGTAYFNLVWPVALGFWWCLRTSAIRRAGVTHRIGGDASMILLPATVLMAACPWVSASRSGAVIALGELGACLLVMASLRRPWNRPLAILGVATLLGLGAVLVDGPVQRRFDRHASDTLENRAAVRQVVARMSGDAGWLGTGAGSFAGVYPLYRTGPNERWVAFAHNDWVETRVTLGWFGLALAVVLLISSGVAWRTGRGPRASPEFSLLVAIALSGALIQATVEYPFQVPSIAFAFLLVLAIALATPGIRTRTGGQ